MVSPGPTPRRFVWSDLPLRVKGALTQSVPFGTLVCVLAALFFLHREQDEAARRVERTRLFGAEIDELQAVYANAETGVHGYVLTRDKELLEPLRAAQYLSPGLFARLAALAGDEPPQVARLRRVRTLAGESLARWTTLADHLDGLAAGPANAPPAPWTGDHDGADRLRHEMAALDAGEDRLLAGYEARLAQLGRRRFLVYAGGLALGLGGTLAALWLLNRGILRRVRRLRGEADRLADGTPPAPAPPARDEIGDLARSLHRAGNLLAARNQALDENLRRLRQSERLYRAFANNFPNGSVFLFDHDLRFLVADGRGLSEVGPARETVEGRTIWEVFSPETAGPLEGLYRAALDGVAQSREMAYEDRLYHVQTSPVRDETGHIYAGLTVTQDISEQRRTEEALRLARDESERANAAKSEFLSRMSHELRTPLNAVLGFAQLLELDAVTPLQTDALGHILKAGRHLLGLINEVLDLARVEAGHLHLTLEPVSAREVFQESADLVRPLADQRDLAMECRLGASHENWVLADRQRLKQILVNLLSNAVKFNRPGGRITASCHAVDAGRVRLCVRDTGVGIAAADRGRIFSAFERLSADRAGVEGTGLGLALTRRLAEMMSGSIDVESVVGEGSVFCLELPRAEPVEPPPPPVAENRFPTGPAGQRHTVLYIEDNPSNLDLVTHILGTRPGLRLLTAVRGDLGLTLARTHRPDLILLDLDLPDMHGREALGRLRADPPTRQTPVVVVSADAMPRGVEQTLAAGANAYLTKPINVREFLQVLDEQLGACPAALVP